MTSVGRQVVFNEQPPIRRELAHHHLYQANMTGAIPSGGCQDRRLAGSRLKSAMHPDLPTPPVVGLKGGPMASGYPFLSGISLHGQRPQFVYADHPRPRWRLHVRRNDGPLFSTNCGSCFSASWNQLCWRFHLNPSSSIHPCPDGGVREVDTMALLESTLESFQRPEFIWHSPQGNPAVPLASYMRLCNCHVNDPVIYWE